MKGLKVSFKITGQIGPATISDLRRFQRKSTLVCGGRDFVDDELTAFVLDLLRPTIIIEGGYRGADTMAREWAFVSSTHCATVPAQWDELGGQAGPLRNRAMLLLRPDVVVAFPGGRGTRDMYFAAAGCSVPVVRVVPGP